MNIAAFSIKRPIFVSSIVLLITIVGYVSLRRLGVDLFPDVNIPFITITSVYVGAGPEEIEELISKPMEEELSSLGGLKKISSYSQEGVSLVICEFELSADIKDAEQQVRNRVARLRSLLPSEMEEPVITRFDPADQPVVRLSLTAKEGTSPARLYEIADELVKIPLEQIAQVGAVKILGGVKRQIQVEVDRNKLNAYNLAALWVAQALRNWGVNVPVGKYEFGSRELSFRTLGRFESLEQIENAVISFGGDVGSFVRLRQVAQVIDTTEDPKTYAFLYGPTPEENQRYEQAQAQGKSIDPKTLRREKRQALFIDVFKQSKANTVEVAEKTKKKIMEINKKLSLLPEKAELILVRDGSRSIKLNIDSVFFDLILGIILAVGVVYLFLGNVRSTIITGLALPNSLLGAFILMLIMDFTINLMTLLALTLVIGLLIDDAIVVRENIFKKLEAGHHPVKAAEKGTMEVFLAVIATSATVIAVFLPVGFLQGIVGQFFKQFGFTVVFALLVSTFDALTVAPMLSAYFAGRDVHARPNIIIRYFSKFQDVLDALYDRTMHFALRKPLVVVGITTLVFLGSCASLLTIKKTFLPPNDTGEFLISLELPPGTSLDGTREVTEEIVQKLAVFPEIDILAAVVGTSDGLSNQATIMVRMVELKYRKISTDEMKKRFREILKNYAFARPSVNDYSPVGGGVQYPFNLNLMGQDLQQLEEYAKKLQHKLAEIDDLIDVDTDYRPGKPEFQVKLRSDKMQQVGVSPAVAGSELRYHIAGGVVGKYYEKGKEYEILLRLRNDQRNLKEAYEKTYVPNQTNRLIPLSYISVGKMATGPARISRQDRSRIIQIRANLSANGAIQSAEEKARRILEKELPPPSGISYAFWGQAKDFRELVENMLIAFALALLFIYLVLSSLYESFITPLTILLAIPPAVSGAFLSLAITGQMLNIFSMIGVILLMGLVTKNSILLVDYAVVGIRHGMKRSEAIYRAGQLRLRPILMTSYAMIAGILPTALGLDEVSKMRQAMGISIIGGLVVSTLLTIFVVPAVFGAIDKVREAIESRFRPNYDMSLVGKEKLEEENPFEELKVLAAHRLGPPDFPNEKPIYRDLRKKQERK
ncbi:MAG: efflux RND transporter permease subunit [Leptospiraceae bacterium]|nr:efflux RND transporter permease subunit [Leptospiraceae bacterium]